jgi:hypothetical protein
MVVDLQYPNIPDAGNKMFVALEVFVIAEHALRVVIELLAYIFMIKGSSLPAGP